MTDNTVKLIISAAAAAVWSYFHQLVWPFAILVLVMCVDYITGVHAAWVRGELKSRTGLIGFLRKLSYIAMVVVGCVIDYLMTQLSAQLTGSDLTVRFVGLTMICWLIINELISILENVGRIGGPVPPFVAPLLAHLKQSTEAQIPAAQLPKDTMQPAGRHERTADDKDDQIKGG